ncbi:hypothetical protein ADEAN_000917600 [Angomonas deanei]|uniref:ubiquitinyl hydrolase 1 n=1 Tax=Angomonas deanei TaxID=59799 RepID=A0A7G2CRN5_9TRYP|nr:hypothetical protein ADEAN_000917600 [Angomonas deanei]
MMDPEKGFDHLFQTLLRDDDEEEEEQKKKNTPSKAVTPNWVNTVLQGKLLNIIQCHHPLDTDENNKKVCGHEIVKEETFLNLTLNVPDEEKKVEKKKKTEDPFENHLAIPVDDITDDTEEEEEEKCYSLFKLLSQSIFAHSKLENYACDECKTKNSQIQSAVFYGTLPVLLVIQLKRFYLKLIYDEKGRWEKRSGGLCVV